MNRREFARRSLLGTLGAILVGCVRSTSQESHEFDSDDFRWKTTPGDESDVIIILQSGKREESADPKWTSTAYKRVGDAYERVE